ncbi:MAG TPA: radical SAM protein [Blastocatellia bacterium]|nr:radical SAM protein [Blastocatellia bacterium]
MRLSKRLEIYLREVRFLVKGFLSTEHPILAHLVVTRRCNLSCAYCNEYDSVSQPVPTEVLLRRVEILGDMKVGCVTLTGGEPLLHPELETVIAHIRKQGALAGLITNGYLLTRERIRKLNAAGLDHLQISIDNVKPDEVSKKSLKVLDQKLVWLAELAQFRVNINAVLGSGVRHPEDALVIGQRAIELGFTTSLGIIHDGLGMLKPLVGVEREVYLQMRDRGKRNYTRIRKFQDNLINGKPNEWRCRAGARYLYICEDGLVHYCSQQRGYPAIPLEQYTKEDRRREYLTKKACAPYCTIACVHQVAWFDNWRDPQTNGVKGMVRRDAIKVIKAVSQTE